MPRPTPAAPPIVMSMVMFSASGLRLKPNVLAKDDTRPPVLSVTGRLRLDTVPNTLPLIWAAVVTVAAELAPTFSATSPAAVCSSSVPVAV